MKNSSLDSKIKNVTDRQKGGAKMNDSYNLYEKAKNMEPQELIKHIKEAKSDEERIFYASIANLELQKRHKEVVERNLF